jgi:hypothetical protein
MAKIDRTPPELPSAFKWRPHPATDFIDMEFVIQEIDESLRAQVIAARFETIAAVNRALADGAAKISGILSGKQRG